MLRMIFVSVTKIGENKVNILTCYFSKWFHILAYHTKYGKYLYMFSVQQIKVYWYSEVFLNRHVFAFFKTSVLNNVSMYIIF